MPKRSWEILIPTETPDGTEGGSVDEVGRRRTKWEGGVTGEEDTRSSLNGGILLPENGLEEWEEEEEP